MLPLHSIPGQIRKSDTMSLSHGLVHFPIDGTQLLSSIKPSSVFDFLILFLSLWALALWATRGIWWHQPDPFASIWFEVPQLKDGEASMSNSRTRNIAERLRELERSIVIFWGSQSGTAERCAHRFSRDLKVKLGVESLVADLSDYDANTVALLEEDQLAVFLISTYGEGDPSDNANALWEWLATTKGQSNMLQRLRYLAFGLGNSTYLHYNRAVDVVDEALKAAGAQSLAPVGKADDANGGTEEDFLGWKASIVSLLSAHFKIDVVDRPVDPSCLVEEDSSLDVQDLYLGDPLQKNRAAGHSPTATLQIKAHRELFMDTNRRNCLHLEVDLSGYPQIAYKTGDHFGVWAVNPDLEVDALLKSLGLTERRHTPILIKGSEPGIKLNVPSPTTADALLRYYLEICASVSRDTIQSLKSLAPSADAAAWLDKLSRDSDLYSAYLAEHHITLGKVLQLASSAGGCDAHWPKLSIAHIIDLLPRIQPRYYSISSSSVVTPRTAHLTVLVAPQPLPRSTAEVIPGLASSHLLHLTRQSSVSNNKPTGDESSVCQISGFVRKSKFKLPISTSCPLIMIAAGTGFAPFRAFVQERARLKEAGRDIGRMMLFFGCQHPERDQIYAAELDILQQQLGQSLTVVKAFSRLNPDQKEYVQHKVLEHGRDVIDMLDQGANLYVCGRTSMSRDVGACIRNLRSELSAQPASAAESWMENLRRARKWQEDVWG